MSSFLVGLGNPGKEYGETRHNLGFMVVDELSSRLSITLAPGNDHYLIGRGKGQAEEGGEEVYLVKPLTFVNASGVALLHLVETFGIGCESILVVCDDVNLPLGKIRLRRGGSDGGHKGLESIIYHLRTEEFSRLRIGVGRSEGPELVKFVLSKFDRREMELARDAVGRAADAAICWATEGVERAMAIYNPDPGGRE